MFTVVAWRRLAAHRRARAYAPLDEIFASPFTPPVSVVLPAYNEEAGIVPSVTSLLDLRYPRHEVIDRVAAPVARLSVDDELADVPVALAHGAV